jgi:hypothetical protein
MMEEFRDLQKAASVCRLEAAELQRRADDYLRLAEGFERHLDLKQSVDRLRQLRAKREVVVYLNRRASYSPISRS